MSKAPRGISKGADTSPQLKQTNRCEGSEGLIEVFASPDQIRDRECQHLGWSFWDSTMGELQLFYEKFKQYMTLRNAVATCLCLTSCGNFLLLGYFWTRGQFQHLVRDIHRGTYNHTS
jgi:hypothetical protein